MILHLKFFDEEFFNNVWFHDLLLDTYGYEFMGCDSADKQWMWKQRTFW